MSPWPRSQARALPEQCHNVPCISLLRPFSHRIADVGVLVYLSLSLWAASGQKVPRLGCVLPAPLCVGWMNQLMKAIWADRTLTSPSLAIHGRCYGNPEEQDLTCLRERIRDGFPEEGAPEMHRHPGCRRASEGHRSLRKWGSSGLCNSWRTGSPREVANFWAWKVDKKWIRIHFSNAVMYLQS